MLRRIARGAAIPSIILAIVLAAFWPALQHAPRADQLAFLMDMMLQDSCGDFVLNSYSYNRTRVILPGDAVLFRPLMFAYLSLVQCMGGTHLWISQALGIALHASVALLVFSLLKLLLREIAADARLSAPAAGLAALYFATSPAIMEQVIWAHINAYLLAASCVLGVMLIQARAGIRGRLAWRHVVAICALCMLACFTYEITLFLPLTLSLCAAAGWMPSSPGGPGRWKLAGVLLLPALAYIGANFLDLTIHPLPGDARADRILAAALSWESIRNFFRFLEFAVAYPYIAGKPEAFINSRLWLTEPRHLAGLITPVLICGFAALWTAGYLATRRLGGRARVALVSGAVALTWLLISSLLITLGRINPDSQNAWVISASSYQSYMPYLASMLLLVTSVASIVVMASRRNPGTIPGSRLLLALAGACLLTIAIRATLVHSVNSQLAWHQAPLVNTANAINTVRDRHAGATFRMSSSVANQLERFQGLPVLYTLFVRSIDQCGAIYEILAAPPYVQSSKNRPCDPVLAHHQAGYNYYYYRDRGEYYGLPHWFGFPDDPDGNDSPYLIRAPSLEQAIRQQPERFRRVREDLDKGRIVYPEASFLRIR